MQQHFNVQTFRRKFYSVTQ